MQRTIISSYLTKDLKSSVKNYYHKHLLNFFFFYFPVGQSKKCQCWHWADLCNCRIWEHEITGKFVLKELQEVAKWGVWWACACARVSVTKDTGEDILLQCELLTSVSLVMKKVLSLYEIWHFMPVEWEYLLKFSIFISFLPHFSLYLNSILHSIK